jgi:hypothetical protein
VKKSHLFHFDCSVQFIHITEIFRFIILFIFKFVFSVFSLIVDKTRRIPSQHRLIKYKTHFCFADTDADTCLTDTGR